MRWIVMIIATAVAVEAGVLVDWKLDTITGPTENNTRFDGVPATNAAVAPQISVTDLNTASSPGHNGLVWSSGNAGAGKLNLQRWDHPNDASGSFGNGNGNPNNWLQFEIIAAPGSSLRLDSIRIAAWRNGAGAPSNWATETSTDSGQTWMPFGDVHSQNTSGDSLFHPVTFTGTTSGDRIFVRFIAIGPTGGTGNIHINQFIVDGAIIEAEPPPIVTIHPLIALVQPGQLISLSAQPAGASIFFTLDGTAPDGNATPFTGPFPIFETTTVRAIAINDAGLPGPWVERTFTVASPLSTPNVVLIVGSDIGFGDLHCNGAVNISTPALDSLAYDGIRFTQFTNTGGGGHAAQYAMLTGRIVARSGMTGSPPEPGASGWRSEEWTLAEMMRRTGYQTAFVGEWLLGNTAGSHPNDQGFQLFHGLPYAMANDPPLEENGNTIAPSPDPANLLGTLTQRAATVITTEQTPFFLTFQPPALPAQGASLAGPHGNRVEALDAAVGELLAALEARDIVNETLVIFLTNGGAPRTIYGGSNGIFRDGAGTTWEGGLRAPLIARMPGTLPAAQMNLSLIWMPDLMPTLTALVGGGLAPDRPLDGMPRANALTGAQSRPTATDTAFGLRWVIGPGESRYLHPNEVTLAEGLKARGYATAMFGKWHLGTPNSANNFTPDALPLAHGFDSWYGTNVSHDYDDARLIISDPNGNSPAAGYRVLRENIGIAGNDDRYVDLTGEYRDRTAAFIRAHRDVPFFAYVALNMPHLQIAVTGQFDGVSERGLLGDTMAEIDDLVATIRSTLEAEGVAENTLVVFTSDNGHWIRFQNDVSHPKYGEARIHVGSARPFRDGKGSTWEGGMRVPGVFWWPGTIEPRTVSRLPASAFDILPTVFALAGQPLPAGRTLDGRDIRPYFNPATFAGSVPDFEFIFTGFDQNPVYAARKGPWKLHTHLYSQTGSNYGFAANSSNRLTLTQPLLFQIENDPSERFNQSDQQSDVVADLLNLISAFNASHTAEGTFWD